MLTQPILLIEDHHVVPLVNTHYTGRFTNSNADPADPLGEDHHVMLKKTQYLCSRFINSTGNAFATDFSHLK
jgi:hypothetical protein